MDIIITDWALQSYLDLVHGGVITPDDYWKVLRPDVELLQHWPNGDPKLGNSNFIGPATDRSGNPIRNGYKMKWHNIGPGRVQLRLSIAIEDGSAWLCRGYVKSSPQVDKREAARLKHHINVIAAGNCTIRGTL